ncbi:DeoR/GlpR family DNA-binding transcription regulator [Actinoallomurus purpureus]|uniref:DeoR/GlpR family DNA-binding transcription regulator n=1 Tax=Actinoallomurus purpureus TaxID=478114 RepID=UPI002091F228|nr:DeoR/GlpR family DNA-binding transcription regulator [Actinoallomurus purpureus]MCO6006858.1 DeoR/GlpR family DNA-binding transcription regulator [Actinoallomurus purpureus]
MAEDAPEPATSDAAGARDRREKIRRRVVDEGFVHVKSLAEAYDVSVMTIHRDLDALQSEGWLRKIRGGATAQPSAMYHGDVRHRLQAMAEAKRQLAHTAAGLVSPGASIMIDESTTGLAIAELLPALEPLTVITNFLAAVNLLAGKPGIDLIALGGAYYPAYDAFLGLRTSETIRSLHADVLFMSTTAITNGHCYHQSQETVAVKRALMDSVDRRVLLVDHSKFAKNGLHQLAPLTAFDLVVVDSGTPQDQVAALRTRGVPLHVAGSGAPPAW